MILTQFFRRRQRKFLRSKRRRFVIEQLEDRRLLATVSWDGGGGNLLWSNPLNWSSDQLPGSSDDVTLDASGLVTFGISSGEPAYVKSLTLRDSLLISQGTLNVMGAFSTDSGIVVSATGASTKFLADNETQLNGCSILVNSGAMASFQSVRNYVGIATAYTGDPSGRTTTLRASGSGSILDLPNLGNIDSGPAQVVTIEVSAESGGRISMPKLTQISDATQNLARRVFVNADGAGSVIDASTLTNFTDNSYYDPSSVWDSSLSLKNGASVYLGAETTLTKVILTIDSNSMLFGHRIIVNSGSTLQGTGDLWSAISNYGRVVVPSGANGLRIHGDYLQGVSGSLAISVDGTTQSDLYSKLTVDGFASLAGTLEIGQGNSFVPDLFSDYGLIVGESVSGKFSTTSGGIFSGGNLTPVYGASGVALSRNFERDAFATFNYQNTSANQRTFLNVSQVTQGRVEFRLYDPAGKLVTVSNASSTTPDLGDIGPFVLKDIGTYQLRTFVAPGDSPVFVYNIAPAPLIVQPGAFKKVTSGEIAVIALAEKIFVKRPDIGA